MLENQQNGQLSRVMSDSGTKAKSLALYVCNVISEIFVL